MTHREATPNPWSPEPAIESGWGLDRCSHLAHYYVGGVSLCRRYSRCHSALRDDNHDAPDNCKVCRDEREAMHARQKAVRP